MHMIGRITCMVEDRFECGIVTLRQVDHLFICKIFWFPHRSRCKRAHLSYSFIKCIVCSSTRTYRALFLQAYIAFNFSLSIPTFPMSSTTIFQRPTTIQQWRPKPLLPSQKAALCAKDAAPISPMWPKARNSAFQNWSSKSGF